MLITAFGLQEKANYQQGVQPPEFSSVSEIFVRDHDAVEHLLDTTCEDLLRIDCEELREINEIR